MKRLVIVLVLICMLTLPALAATSGCPSSRLTAYKVASNVAATFSTSGGTATYSFVSLTNENPVNGVPGLMKYCIYPTAQPNTISPQAKGANRATWVSRTDPHDFAFVRTGGDKTDIPLDGKTTTMGTATWSGSAPSSQTILLHINDPAVCTGLYGSGSPGTCFVKPSLANSCVAGEGQTVAAYNAMPYGGVNCSPPSLAFEGDGVAEFGDEVALAGTARQLDKLNVLFTSYGCSVSGHWNSGDCMTNAGDTFAVPITATIYAGDNCTTDGCTPGAVIATATKTFNVPYRPSADLVNCPDDPYGYASGSRWFNPLGNGGAGACQYSIATVLTFDNFTPSGQPLNDNVIWTVAYNTSHSGYNPIAQPLGPGDPCESSPGGCGYDSLNVGTKSYPGAPYAGVDVSDGVVWYSYYAGSGVPTNYPPPFGSGVLTPPTGIGSSTETPQNPPETWGTGYRPLGEIVTK